MFGSSPIGSSGSRDRLESDGGVIAEAATATVMMSNAVSILKICDILRDAH